MEEARRLVDALCVVTSPSYFYLLRETRKKELFISLLLFVINKRRRNHLVYSLEVDPTLFEEAETIMNDNDSFFSYACKQRKCNYYILGIVDCINKMNR